MRYFIILAISIALPIWISAITSPTFWASIPIGNKYVGMVKVGLGVGTFIILSALTSGKKD